MAAKGKQWKWSMLKYEPFSGYFDLFRQEVRELVVMVYLWGKESLNDILSLAEIPQEQAWIRWKTS